MDFTRPLWVGHHGICFTCPKASIKGNNKHSQLIICNNIHDILISSTVIGKISDTVIMKSGYRQFMFCCFHQWADSFQQIEYPGIRKVL